MQKRRTSNLNLLRQVFAELTTALGDDYSPTELLKAAQILIDTAKAEQDADWTLADWNHHPDYYNQDTYTVLSSNPWMALEHEIDSKLMYDSSKWSDDEISHYFRDLHNINRPKWYKMGDIFD